MVLLKKKRRYKPFYKQFLRLRINIQNRRKLFKFKKKKWVKFQFYSKRTLKFFKRYKFKDQFRLFVNKFSSKGNSLKKKFKKNLQERKILSLFYGGFNKNYFKNNISKSINNKKLKYNCSKDLKHNVIYFFEARLDTVLYRSGFCLSIKAARKLILQKHVFVNKKLVTTGSYNLKLNDLIEISENIKIRNIIKKNLLLFNFWPVPTKHLLINYTTLQILFLYKNSFNLIPTFNHYLNINSIVSNIKKW